MMGSFAQSNTPAILNAHTVWKYAHECYKCCKYLSCLDIYDVSSGVYIFYCSVLQPSFPPARRFFPSANERGNNIMMCLSVCRPL